MPSSNLNIQDSGRPEVYTKLAIWLAQIPYAQSCACGLRERNRKANAYLHTRWLHLGYMLDTIVGVQRRFHHLVVLPKVDRPEAWPSFSQRNDNSMLARFRLWTLEWMLFYNPLEHDLIQLHDAHSAEVLSVVRWLHREVVHMHDQLVRWESIEQSKNFRRPKRGSKHPVSPQQSQTVSSSRVYQQPSQPQLREQRPPRRIEQPTPRTTEQQIVFLRQSIAQSEESLRRLQQTLDAGRAYDDGMVNDLIVETRADIARYKEELQRLSPGRM